MVSIGLSEESPTIKFLDPQLATIISDRLNERHKKLKTQLMRKEQEFHRNIRVLDEEEKRLVDLLMAKTINELTYKKKHSEITDRRSKLNNEILKIHNLHSDYYLTTAQTVLELAKNAKTLWASQNDLKKLDLMEKVLWNSTLSDVSVEFNLKKPFEKLSEVKKNQGKEKWGGFVDNYRNFLRSA